MESSSGLTHFNEQGRARMVDVTEKAETKRSATARCSISMQRETLELIKQVKLKKGDVLAVAQVAGIMGAKQTSSWIPMCHPIALTGIDIQFSDNGDNELYIEATVRTTGQTGVEMEALTAVSAAALTIYDMCKAVEKSMVISSTMLLAKTGGKNGDFHRNAPLSS
ncbi:cyclic pyranopterin monophosphate synthase MoaC [Paenibacillus eucommiae]|uniref:Cyclic pyranopterin monophosphate synthase n=1 Tax=Paenibacillus eucommiae TaxID=1355755 RepID=A0ABS4J7B1_9BACL|nr:cyclic pyranopterin monophosphate synthase MoaC [Paenibacillus eucommiae]MBP1994991.1 cyclic pyranopterin phosphate synthase [Paenibacillus eucommiae]